MIDTLLIDRIYEAAALPERWPAVLADLGRRCGAAGGLFFSSSPSELSWIASPEVAWIIEDYIAEGWMATNERGAPMIAEMHPGFRTDGDYRSADERATVPVYRDFLIPRGIDAAAGTVFQGPRHNAIVLTFEHFASHEHAAAAIQTLDQLRPDLGRALSLTASLGRERAITAVRSLDLAGVSAAVVSDDGRLRAVNDGFAARLGNQLGDQRSGFCFADRRLQARFSEALAAISAGAGVRTIAVAAIGEEPPFAMHLLPLRLGARDVYGWDGILLMVAEVANAAVPNADLLRLLFDLTPAEARMTRLFLEGSSIQQTAKSLRISAATARAHLKSVYGKTGVGRQAELMRLLLGLGAGD